MDFSHRIVGTVAEQGGGAQGGAAQGGGGGSAGRCGAVIQCSSVLLECHRSALCDFFFSDRWMVSDDMKSRLKTLSAPIKSNLLLQSNPFMRLLH